MCKTMKTSENKEKSEIMKKTIASTEEIQSSNHTELSKQPGKQINGLTGPQMSKTSV